MKFEKLKPLFICGHRRSGTTLLTSLLDFHDEIMMYPDDSKFFHLFYPFVELKKLNVKQRQQLIIDKNFKYLKDNLIKKIKINPKLLNFTFLEEDFLSFTKKTKNWESFLHAMIRSLYNNTFQEKKDLKYWGEKTTSSEIYIEEINKKFRKAKFIHIIRDPRAIYASLKSGWGNHYKKFNDSKSLDLLLQSCIDRYGYSINLAKNNEVRFKDNYLIIKYEELVEKPTIVLNKVKKFLVLKKNIKLNPTIYGHKWDGNNFSNIKFSKIEKKRTIFWKSYLNNYEKGVLDFHFGDFLKYYNYKNISSLKRQNEAISKYYKWRNFESEFKADIK